MKWRLITIGFWGFLIGITISIISKDTLPVSYWEIVKVTFIWTGIIGLGFLAGKEQGKKGN